MVPIGWYDDDASREVLGNLRPLLSNGWYFALVVGFNITVLTLYHPTKERLWMEIHGTEEAITHDETKTVAEHLLFKGKAAILDAVMHMAEAHITS